jgi:hypothetical protein
MSNIIKLKNSGTASATPSYLEYGELALNYNDEKIFYKNNLDEIIEFNLNPIAISINVEGTVFNATIGNSTDTEFTITHNFGNRDISVSIREAAAPYGLVITQWEATTEDSITVYFESPPTLNSVRVSIYLAVAGAPSTSLGGLSDVILTSLATNEVLQYDGSNWVNQAFAGGITSITAGTGLSGGTITTSGTISIDNTVVTLTGTQTLENKTLTSPVISSIVNTGTLTLPTSTDTLVGRSTTDTLTNKTLTSPVINTPDIILSTSSSTTDARIFWDSTNKKIKVGNGSISLDFVSSNIIQNQQIASYTLVLTDKDKMVEMSVGSANTLTVPPESSVNFPVGSQITILQTNTGQTTIVAGSGVTVNATPGLKLRARWSSVVLVKRASDTWVALGDLQA